MIKKLIVMRALPGSGKSTYVSKLPNPCVCSIDSYFYRNGVWEWKEDELSEAWKHCDVQFSIFMDRRKRTIVLDNVNSKISDFIRYVVRAKSEGYQVSIVEILERNLEMLASRGKHSLTVERLQQISDEWEEIPPDFADFHIKLDGNS